MDINPEIKNHQQVPLGKMSSVLFAYAALIISTSVGAVSVNLILLLLFALHLKLRTDTWALTLNLSLCDIIFGISVSSVAIYSSVGGATSLNNAITCKVIGFILVLLQLASLNSLLWTTVDKFTEICFPLRYTQIVTKRRVWIILIFVWSYAIVVAALPLLRFGDYSFNKEVYVCLPSLKSTTMTYSMMLLIVGVITPISVISVLYIAIIHIARNQAKRGTFFCNDQHCYYVPIRSYFRNTLLIVSAFYLLVCWIPSVTTHFYEMFHTHNVPPIVQMASTCLVIVTSGINPCVNSLAQRFFTGAGFCFDDCFAHSRHSLDALILFNRKYRKALQESWQKLKRSFQNMVSSSELPSENEIYSSLQIHRCLPGHTGNMANSTQT